MSTTRRHGSEATTRPETTAKFIAAKFEHDTARPVDGYVAPQLHTHAVIFNMTERENGQYRAVQPQSLFASQQFATAVYQSELTYRLRELGYATVVGVDRFANHLSVQLPSGTTATYDARRLAGINVYHTTDREFAIGDRIQFTAPDKSLGVANRDLAIIDSIGADGWISVHLDNGRRIEFNPESHQHFDHGYAVTSHSAQGLTAERVLINADTAVHPDLLNSRFGYVAISRASHEATVFTNDMSRLGHQLATEVSKSSAVEINQGHPISQGISMI